MKLPILIYSAFLLIVLLTQCDSKTIEPSNCDIPIEFIAFNEESFNAFPIDFLNKKEFIFLDSLGSEKKFIGEFRHDILESSNSIYCQEDDKWIRLYNYERYVGIFIAADSLRFTLLLTIKNEDCDNLLWNENFTVDRLYITCIYYRSTQNAPFIVGLLSNNISNYNNDHPEINCLEQYREVNEITLAGKSYNNVWSSPEVNAKSHDIFYKYGEGIVGLIDTSGVSWRIK